MLRIQPDTDEMLKTILQGEKKLLAEVFFISWGVVFVKTPLTEGRELTPLKQIVLHTPSVLGWNGEQ